MVCLGELPVLRISLKYARHVLLVLRTIGLSMILSCRRGRVQGKGGAGRKKGLHHKKAEAQQDLGGGRDRDTGRTQLAQCGVP